MMFLITANFRKLVCQLLGKFDVEITAFNYEQLRLNANDLKEVIIDEPTCKRALAKFYTLLDDFIDHNKEEISKVANRIANIDIEEND